MKSPEHIFFERLKAVSLEKKRLDRLHQTIRSHMQSHPVVDEITPERKNILTRIAEGMNAFVGVLQQQFRFAVVIVIVIIGVSGITVVAAESALPGDFLYSVKTEVTEEAIAAMFSFMPELHAQWDVERIERRIEEVLLLSHEDAVEEEGFRNLVKNLDEHIEDVLAVVEGFEENGNVEQASVSLINLKASLHAGARFVSQFADSGQSARSRRAIAQLEAQLRREKREIQSIEEGLHVDIVQLLQGDIAMLDDHIDRVEVEVKESEELLESGSVVTDLQEEISSKVKSAIEILRQARLESRLQTSDEVYLHANEASFLAEQAEELLEFAEHLDAAL